MIFFKVTCVGCATPLIPALQQAEAGKTCVSSKPVSPVQQGSSRPARTAKKTKQKPHRSSSGNGIRRGRKRLLSLEARVFWMFRKKEATVHTMVTVET